MSRRGIAKVIGIAAFLAMGCVQARYLSQAAWGQLDLLSRREPIERLIRTEQAPPKLAALLRHVDVVKSFGHAYGLRASHSYRDYAELPREAAVWVVTACAPLAFEEKTWLFPVVGSVPYLGWFDRDAAGQHAASLTAQGLDAYVRGAGAYSTLGWFDDPVLSTMVPRGPDRLGRLVNTVLHEAVHATVYVNDQSFFNEALASFTADGLTPLYLSLHVGASSVRSIAYERAQARWAAQDLLLRRAYAELAQIYADPSLPDDAKRQRKNEVYGALQRDLGASEPLNNAALVGMRVYDVARDAFAELFASCRGDWGRFVSAVSGVQAEDFATPQQQDLSPLLVSLAERCL